MEIVVFSDIHGNVEALKKFMSVEKRSSNRRFIFCGDICGYYYQARECVELLKTIEGLVAVRGNHDQYYLEAYNNSNLTKQLVQQYGSSYFYKSSTVYSYIKEMPNKVEFELLGKKIFIQHGSPSDPIEGRVYTDTELENLEYNAIYIAGHTHYQMLKYINNSIWLNPGSLGQPRDGKGFSYCVIDDKLNISFRTVQINIDCLVHEIRQRDSNNRYLEEVLYRNL